MKGTFPPPNYYAGFDAMENSQELEKVASKHNKNDR
jgi:hypothetical protein